MTLIWCHCRRDWSGEVISPLESGTKYTVARSEEGSVAIVAMSNKNHIDMIDISGDVGWRPRAWNLERVP